MIDPTFLLDEIRNMLLDCGLFNLLPAQDLKAAAGYFNIGKFTKGSTVFLEGDAGTFMSIIHSGSVSVRRLNNDEQNVEIAILRKGRAFGEMAVLDGERRSASCVALTECLLLNLGKDSLDKMVQDHPAAAARIIRALAVAMSRRLRMVDGQLLAQT